MIRAIRQAWPGAELTWIVGGVEHGLLAGLEGVEFVILDKRRGLAGYLDVHRRLGGRRFDLLLHMHASVRANLASCLVSADTRLGMDRARARDGQWLFCNRRIAAVPRQHVMDGLFEFARALGIECGGPALGYTGRRGRPAVRRAIYRRLTSGIGNQSGDGAAVAQLPELARRALCRRR